jgi:hypothetical protein
MAKPFSGLKLVDATRISITNSNPQLPAISVNGAKLSYKDINFGPLKVTDDRAYTLDTSDNVFYPVLHTNSEIIVKAEAEAEPGKLAPGQIIPAGSSLFKQQSPAPFCYIDTTGRLGSANLWNNLFVANVMGYVDVDKATHTYNHGLCPAGDSVHDGLFLRKDGQWGQPALYTGSVSETFLSLRDTPLTYTENIDKYLRVSYAEGGSMVFDDINTSKVPETSNLYYTDERVNTRIAVKLQDKSIASIAVSGTITCNEILAESDRTLKENIHDLDPAECLDIIDRIDPKSYTFIGSDRIRFGVIAQEVEQVLPSVVTYSDRGVAAVNYLELIPFLIGSIRDLKAQVDCLKYDLEIISN